MLIITALCIFRLGSPPLVARSWPGEPEKLLGSLQQIVVTVTTVRELFAFEAKMAMSQD